jgi:2'-5' RNA ligase
MSPRLASRRLFFALWPEPLVAEQLAAVGTGIGAKPECLEDLHLTALFLGQVPETRIEALLAAAGQIRHGPVYQPLVSLEVWPQSGVLCLVGDPVAPLEGLREALGRASRAAGLDLVRERLEFRPHVTLGRIVDPGAALAPPRVAAVLLVARRFTLAESLPRRDGRRYEALASWSLE